MKPLWQYPPHSTSSYSPGLFFWRDTFLHLKPILVTIISGVFTGWFPLNNGILACGNIDRSDLKFILCLMCGVSQPCIDNFHTKEFYSDLCQLWFEEYYCNVFVVSITFSGVILLKVIYPKTWNPERGILFFICLLWNFEIKDYQKNLIWTRSK